MLVHAERPHFVRDGAYYPWHPAFEKGWTFKPKYVGPDELPIKLWKRRKNWIVLPVRATQLDPLHKDYRTDGSALTYTSRFKPRHSDQERAAKESAALLLSGTNHVLRAPTGWGKTVIGTEVALRYGRSTLILVHKEDLIEQWQNSIRMLTGCKLSDIGLIRGNKCDYEHQFVIAMLQSVAKDQRYPHKVFEGFGLTIADEVHRLGADFFSQAMWNLPARARLGVSATPQRRDGRDMVFEAHIGPQMVVGKKKAMGFIAVRSPSGWYCPRNNYGDRLKHQAGKVTHITKTMVHANIRNKMIINFAKRAWLKGRKVIVFSELKAHLETLSTLLAGAGVPKDQFAMYVGGLSKKAKAAALTKPMLLATYRYCSEGTDIPWADTMILGMPRSEVEQIVGRILREHEGKQTPVVLDITDGDSPVFVQYAEKRLKWYQSVSAEVRQVKRAKLLEVA